MNERTTVRLPQDLLRRAKRKAAAEGRTLTSLIEEGLRAAIADRRDSGAVARIMPRISQASGGLVAGVDLDDLSGLREAEDLETVRRLRRGA